MSVSQTWHNNLVLFSEFFFLWVLIITPAENISPPFLSPARGWLKIPSMSVLKAEEVANETRSEHHILKSTVHFPIKKLSCGKCVPRGSFACSSCLIFSKLHLAELATLTSHPKLTHFHGFSLLEPLL